MVEAVEHAREIQGLANFFMIFDDMEEQVPGQDVESREEIAQWVKDEAWGHHACCTAKMGDDADPTAVLNSRFEVRGTNGLRVVDASVFPRIPGLFIAAPIYMASERATDIILEDMGETRIEENFP
jgi:choline dehydrogenase